MQLKTFKNGTHRIKAPEETLDKVLPFLKTMGITRVANITGLDTIGIPVVAACRPNSKSLALSQGKGHSYNAAKISAIMEAVEGYHAENILKPIITASYNYLKEENYNVADVYQLSSLITSDCDEDTPIQWIECYEIENNHSIWAPYETISTDFTYPRPPNTGYFISDSNGLASGNSLTEAINHGLYEVIERDCMALWQLTPIEEQNERRINIQTVTEKFLKEYLNKIYNQNIKVAIWDITSDIKIPTFICKIISKEKTMVRPAFGCGTHLDKNIALSRAITEAAQSRLTFISGARDDQYQSVYENEISDENHLQWLKSIGDEAGNIDYSEIATYYNENLEDDQRQILSHLKQVNLKQYFYADITKSQFSIPVVKVVVPGLEGVSFAGERVLGERGLKQYDLYGVGGCQIA